MFYIFLIFTADISTLYNFFSDEYITTLVLVSYQTIPNVTQTIGGGGFYLYGRVLSSVTVSHQELNPRDKITLAPADKKSTQTLSRTVRKDENRVLGTHTQGKNIHFFNVHAGI